jgi:hypothetical protein
MDHVGLRAGRVLRGKAAGVHKWWWCVCVDSSPFSLCWVGVEVFAKSPSQGMYDECYGCYIFFPSRPQVNTKGVEGGELAQPNVIFPSSKLRPANSTD